MAQKQVGALIDSLAVDPRPPGVAALKGRHGRLRVRSGDYRVIYEVRDAELVVLVLALGNRRAVYRDQ